MGNKQSQTDSSPNIQVDHSNSIPNSRRLNQIDSVFEKILTASKLEDETESHNSLTLNDFVTYFQQKGASSYLSEQLFKSMCGSTEIKTVDSNDRKCTLSRKEFCKACSSVVELHGESNIQEFYFTVYAEGRHMSKQALKILTEDCFKLALLSLGLNYDNKDVVNNLMDSLLKTLVSTGSEISLDDFTRYCSRHFPRLLSGVHCFTSQLLLGEVQPPIEVSSDIERLMNGTCILDLGALWLLTCVLPLTYTTSDLTGDSQSVTHVQNPLAGAAISSPWHNLYSSNDHGLSMNRFQNHVFSYRGPTVSVISFEGGHSFAVAVDEEWREGSSRWGQETSTLITCIFHELQPQFRFMKAGAGLMYYNQNNRNLPRCIQVGCDSKSLVLVIDTDFTTVTYYGVQYKLYNIESPIMVCNINCTVLSIEVWGCGGNDVRGDQEKQKQWERKEAQKHAQRKLKLEDWRDNPDKQLLELGGVSTEHAQR
ncbi:unnamed protein product [Owenia fusiformis]|uniref:TLDc domain-containing protein n=1 Tax=Owenia fusiformis TaxID=6347 RepID=A0A8S4Q489_OWEFU|nr:unnamed protein product [Owenia fusiformis]